jgi:hypothetical protein
MSRSKVYKEIQTRLLKQLPDLQYVDMQKGQFAKIQQNYPIPLPACLIEFGTVTWSNAENGSQLGKTTVRVYHYVDLVTDSFDGAEQESETIKLLDVQDSAFEALEGYDGEDFNPLNRINDQPPQYGERFICFRTDFATTLFVTKKRQKAPLPKPKFKFNK